MVVVRKDGVALHSAELPPIICPGHSSLEEGSLCIYIPIQAVFDPSLSKISVNLSSVRRLSVAASDRCFVSHE